MPSGVETINIKALKQYRSEFTSEQSSFQHSSYATFLNGYINHCNDPYIKLMAHKLNELYSEIDRGYSNIKQWWDGYISTYDNLNAQLEKDNSELTSLITNEVSNEILMNSLDNSSGGLDSIDKYSSQVNLKEKVYREDPELAAAIEEAVKIDISHGKNTSFESKYNYAMKKEGYKNNLIQAYKDRKELETIRYMAEYYKKHPLEKLTDYGFFDDVNRGYVKELEILASGAIKGLENFVDFGIVLDSGLMMLGAKFAGIFNKDYGKECEEFVNNYAAESVAIMDEAVSNNSIVKDAEEFKRESYETIANGTNEKVANFFDKYIYGIIEGVGESLPIMFAGGIIGTGTSLLMKAGIFATLGFTDGSGSSFKENVMFNITDPQTGEIIRDESGNIVGVNALNNTLKSTLLGGVWGSLSWGVGSYIGGAQFFENAIANSVTRISIDTIFGGAETFVQSGIQTTYNGKSYVENFKANGGWDSVKSGAVMGGFMSACGEASYLESASKYASLLENNPNEFARKLTEYGFSEADAASAVKNMDPNKLVTELLYLDEINPKPKNGNGNVSIKDSISLKTELDKFVKNIHGENVPITVFDSASSGIKKIINNLKDSKDNIKSIINNPELANAGFVDFGAIKEVFSFGKKKNIDLSELYDNNPGKLGDIFIRSGLSEDEVINILNNSPKEVVITRAKQIIDKFNGKNTESNLKFADYNGDLSAYIFENMPSGLSKLERARRMYIELAKEVQYSSEFANSDPQIRPKYAGNGMKLNVQDYENLRNKVYNNKIDINLYRHESIVCSNWAQMYADLLKKDNINYKICGKAKTGNHQFIKFEIDGKYYYADGFLTTGDSDISRIQTGLKPNNFFEITKELYEDDSNSAFDIMIETPNIMRSYSYKKIDEKLGYNYDQLISAFDKNTSLQSISNASILEKYGISSNLTLPELVEQKFEKIIKPKLEQSGVFESIYGYQKLRKIFTNPYEASLIKQQFFINKFDASEVVIYTLPSGKQYIHSGLRVFDIVTDDIKEYLNQDYFEYVKGGE